MTFRKSDSGNVSLEKVQRLSREANIMDETVTFTATESAKCLADALVPGEGNLSWLTSQLTLNEIIGELQVKLDQSRSEFNELRSKSKTLQDGYTQVKTKHDTLLLEKTDFQNRIFDLEKSLSQLPALKQQIAALQAQNQALKESGSRVQLGWENVYQFLNSIVGSKARLFQSTSPKILEITIRSRVANPTHGDALHLSVMRNNKDVWKPGSLNVL